MDNENRILVDLTPPLTDDCPTPGSIAPHVRRELSHLKVSLDEIRWCPPAPSVHGILAYMYIALFLGRRGGRACGLPVGNRFEPTDDEDSYLVRDRGLIDDFAKAVSRGMPLSAMLATDPAVDQATRTSDGTSENSTTPRRQRPPVLPPRRTPHLPRRAPD